MRLLKNALQLLFLFLPWGVRRPLLCLCFGFEIDRRARIGLAWVAPRRLKMEAHASIGHFTVCKGLDLLHLKAGATIGRGNWITGLPVGTTPHFAQETHRRSALIVGEEAAITHRHLIDCTNCVTIGARTTIAGFRSQILTHSIDLAANRQSSAPVTVGAYCFVGTDAVLLGGSVLPDYSVLGAKALLQQAYTETHRLYAGVPARAVKELDRGLAYFHRSTGFVI